MKIAVVWGSTTGNTETAAEKLQEILGERISVCCNVDDLTAEEMLTYDVVLIGVSTWDIGELQYDWPERVKDMADHDWSKVTFGFFGCGDAYHYEDTFVDAFGIIWETLEPRGAKLIGTWPVDGYEFTDSRSLCNDRKHFLGLPLDDDNEAELTDQRLQSWAEQLQRELDAMTAAQ